MWKCIKALNPFAVELRNTEARLEFARVLLAQAEIELADKAFYVREFAAVSQERDELALGIAHVRAERDAFRAKLQRVTDHNQTITEGYKAEIAALRERASFDPTEDQVEALARVLHKAQDTFYCRYGDHATKFDDYAPLWLAEARAAIAHLSTRPEGLPTADQIKAAHLKYIESYRKGENDGSMCATDFALEYLTPFLRQSVEGECKECAKLRDEVTFWKRENVDANEQVLAAIAVLQTPRAALEANP